AEGAGGARMNMIDPRIHQVLDGELAPGALSAELRRSVERLVTAVALLGAPLPLPSLESRVMALIRRPVPSRARRLLRWLATPRALTFRVRPVWSLAFAAVVPRWTLVPAGQEGPDTAAPEGTAQFVARFPGAQSVPVVGSSNAWRPGPI